MEKSDAVKKLHYITKGIDLDECESDYGWWPNTSGALFGKETLAELEALIVEIYEGNHVQQSKRHS